MIHDLSYSKFQDQTNKQSTDDEKFSFRATTRTKTRIEKNSTTLLLLTVSDFAAIIRIKLVHQNECNFHDDAVT